MYTVHGLIDGKTLPLFFSLLPNKKQESYETLFRIIKQHVQRVPCYITIDFEKGAENAFGVIYPQCQVLGCFFHFKQNIWRNISVSLILSYIICSNFFLQELGLKKEFLENDVYRRTMKNLAALAFVPEKDVVRIFTDTKESSDEQLDGKMFYFHT
jgi:hypothetical protein